LGLRDQSYCGVVSGETVRWLQGVRVGILAGMSKRAWFCSAIGVVAVWLSGGCTKPRQQAPPPDARRPVLKTQEQLAAERSARIRDGTVVPTSAPAILAGHRRAEPVRRPPIPITPARGAIEAEILLVNEDQLTTAEILYPLRERLAEARRSQTERGFQDQAVRWIRSELQQEIGGLLVYREAMAALAERQQEAVEKVGERRLQERITRDFGGSQARLDKHLQRYGLTMEQYRMRLRRSLVVSQYTREKLMPQAHVRRDELLAYYRENSARYCTPGTRELLVIEAPFERFLPEGTTWRLASEQIRAQARLEAMRHIRRAHASLQEKPFEQVAREFSRGPQAENGGSWGQIGQPLQPPYDQVSKLIFEFAQRQCSEPLETATGWYIVKCGRVQPEQRRSFSEVQEEIRQHLMEQKLNRLTADYVVQLAEKATISSLDQFIAAAVRRASTAPWSQPPKPARQQLLP
jgi:hypothetical protein